VWQRGMSSNSHTLSNHLPLLLIFAQSGIMFKQILFFLLLIPVGLSSKAQTTDTLFNKLADFDLARFNNDEAGAMHIGEGILRDTATLTPKVRISFFDRMAKLYEDDEQGAKAVFFYEKVAVAEPNYYVAQRALGYLYNDAAEEIHLKLYQTKKDDQTYQTLFDRYKKELLKALPHLEKAQACDPTDDTLDLIKTLYHNIHDEQGLNSLNDRLTGLSKNCIDILKDK
jgi:tetratricopeptide (TPR) repeat protein